MVNSLDVCPWCSTVLNFETFDWDEEELEKKNFGCRHCGCHFHVVKKVIKPGKDAMLANQKAAVSHIIRAMTS